MADTVVKVKILADATQFKKEIQGATSTLDSVSRKLLSVGTKMTLGVTTPLLLAARTGARTASDLEQSVGAVESVFESAAGAIFNFGETAAQTSGLSRRQVNEMAAVIGASLTGMGYTVDEAADQVVTLEQRAADLAATFGGTTEEAIQAMGSALRGERDPIERYGVSIKEADVQARILALGLDTSTVAAKKTATATATLDLIMESTAKTAGQFAREADTAAGATARAGAEAENATADLGDGLLPVVTKLQEWAGKLGRAFGGLSEEWQNTIVIGGLVLAAIGPIVTIVGGLTAAVGGLSTGLAFLAANPVVLVIAALAALAIGIWIAYQRSETFRRVVTEAWAEVQTATDRMWRVVKPILQAMHDFLIETAQAAERVVDAVNEVTKVKSRGIGGSDKGVNEIIGGALNPSSTSSGSAAPARSATDTYMGPVATPGITQNVTFNGVTDPATLARMTADELSWAMRGV